jgi:arylsulfatase A-like enzyme
VRARPGGLHKRAIFAIKHGMRWLILVLLLLPGALRAAVGPNLLFIYLDDFGWRDASYMGSDFYETPHLDRLAAQGMRFSDAYSAASNCAPARASLLTGQYSPRHEIHNVGTGPRGKAEHRRLLHIPGVDTLNPAIETWASRLQKAGYLTALMGKWHLSTDPVPHGFDINIGGSHSGSPPRGYYPPHPGVTGLYPIPDDEYLTDTLNREAEDFIRRHAGRPWALYLTHFAVHTPLDPKKELVEKYRRKPPGKLHHHVAMATMIEAVDAGVGRIVAALEETGTAERTIIVFTSDNGGFGPATDMAPLKGYKGTYYEGGIRVPLFVVWPGVVAPGSESAVPVTGVDFYPTFCEMLGTTPPDGQPLDGVSLVPLLRGEQVDPGDRPLFWHFPAYLQSYAGVVDEQRDPLFRSRPCSIVRKGSWKLHEYFEDSGYELYNLADDIGETTDLSRRHPKKLVELQRELREWRERIAAPVPDQRNPAYDEAAEKQAMSELRR